MSRKWIHTVLLTAIVVILTACNQTIEEQAIAGIENAEKIFNNEPNQVNKSIGQIELYLPKGYSIEKGIDELNYTILNGKDSYILFVNPNEAEDSQLQYDILKHDGKNEVMGEKKFQTEDAFGFAAVVKQSDKKYDLIVNIGGIKLSTISGDSKLDSKIPEMMEIVQSVHIIE